MVHFERHVTVSADPARVWALASDLEHEPDFWKGTTAVRTLSRDGNVVERETTLAFRGRTQRERVTLDPPRRIVHELTHGPMRGTKTVFLTPTPDGGTELAVVYDVKLAGLLKLGTGPFAKHAAEGTEHALQRIKEAAEGRPPSV